MREKEKEKKEKKRKKKKKQKPLLSLRVCLQEKRVWPSSSSCLVAFVAVVGFFVSSS
jgi:hypothetical protein